MTTATQLLRASLKKIQERTALEPIEVERREQALVGGLLQLGNLKSVRFEEVAFPAFKAALAQPVECRGSGAVLYLHGGGYVCGDLTYAKGFGSELCQETGVQVLCPAYRLAPEHPYPAALEDAMAAYFYLLKTHSADQIVLAGESAGGGLLLGLCLRAKKEGIPLPAGCVCISPWTDLTSSGLSYRENAAIDPSMTKERLAKYASCYTDQPANPLISPLFGDMTGMPDTLFFSGGSEIMRDDAVVLHGRMLAAGCRSELTVAPEMWHGYVLYGVKERRCDMDRIRDFIEVRTR